MISKYCVSILQGGWGGLDGTNHDVCRKLKYSFFGKLMNQTNEIEIYNGAI